MNTDLTAMTGHLVYIAAELAKVRAAERAVTHGIHPLVTTAVTAGNDEAIAIGDALTVIHNIRTHLMMRRRHYRQQQHAV